MNTTRKTLQLFWGHAKRYPWYIAGLALSVPATILLRDIAEPLIIAHVLGMISDGAYNPNDLWGSFGMLIILYAVTSFGGGILGWRINIWLMWKLEMLVQRDLINRVFNHLTGLSAHFHANNFGGSLVSQANRMVGAYIRLADTIVFNLSTLVLMTIFTIAVLAPRVPLYVLFLLIIMAVYLAGALLLSRRIQRANNAESTLQSTQTGYLADAVTNVMAVKSFANETYESKRFLKATENTRSAINEVMLATQVRDLFASFMTSGLSVMAIGIAVVGTSLFHVDIATLFLVVSYTANLASRFWDINSMLRNFNRSLGDARDMVEVLGIEPEVKDKPNAAKAKFTRGAIEFKDMVFSHADASQNETLFEDLNLSIRGGEKIGLVGHSGSGKTTLTRLLLRFSDIDSGAITIDGQDIRDVRQSDLRAHIAYVPQEPLLFHRTIRENIAYGKPDATDAEVRMAAKKAHSAEFIEKLPNGYDTLVGERGVKLSGGQRQRVAIARAILKDAPILVLDEATSALDSESERLIQAALGELMKNRTTIVIAHRLSTIQKMDRIVVLEDGQIIEQGSHTDLLKEAGIYADLWKHQSGGFIEE